MTNSNFIPCFKTRDLQLISILKFHLEENEIPYFITGGDSLFLENLAILSHETYATIYLLQEDIDSFLEFIEEGIK